MRGLGQQDVCVNLVENLLLQLRLPGEHKFIKQTPYQIDVLKALAEKIRQDCSREWNFAREAGKMFISERISGPCSPRSITCRRSIFCFGSGWNRLRSCWLTPKNPSAKLPENAVSGIIFISPVFSRNTICFLPDNTGRNSVRSADAGRIDQDDSSIAGNHDFFCCIRQEETATLLDRGPAEIEVTFYHRADCK